jgi:hypothetical protein
MRAEQIETLAAVFWERAGVPVAFPRELEQAIPLAVPVGVVRLEDLFPITVRRWFLRRGIRLPLEVQDRQLDGCIVAYGGRAVIFLAADLETCDERLILAHELGHFLADYEWPRQRILKRLGLSILPVLDGARRPSPAEDLGGVLAGVSLGAHVHYMERGFDPRSIALTDRVERTASELGCELLAPRQTVLSNARERNLPDHTDLWGKLLRDEFGLPERWADQYAARLLRRQDRGRTFTDLLGL